MDTQIKEMLMLHLPNRYEDTLACYDCFTYEDWKDYNEDGSLKGFISYFFLDFKYDMVITAATGDIFSRAQWKILRDTIKNRTKPISIQSDPNKPALHKAAARLGGEFYDDTIYFK